MRPGGGGIVRRVGRAVKAIVLAGGLGTRLVPITGNVPKPMAAIGSRPFLEYVLDYLISQGIEEAILAVSYEWQQIQAHFGKTYRGLLLRYSVEDQPLGTGGAIRQALEFCSDDMVAVLNGDTLFQVNLGKMAELHERHNGLLTMALKYADDCGRFGRVEISADDVVTGFLEKSGGGPGWINGGVYMAMRRLFELFPMPEKFSFELDMVEANVDRIRPLAYRSGEYFIDMGVPEDFERARIEVGGGK